LDPNRVKVEPGQAATCTVWIENRSDVVEQYDVEVLGASGSWASVDARSVALFPNAKGSATVQFHPPRTWQAPAGSTPFAVRVVPRSAGPGASVVEEGIVDVAPLVAVEAALAPQTSRGWLGGRHRVRLSNTGNVATPVRLSASDPENALSFSFKPSHPVLAAGAGIGVRMRVGAPTVLRLQESRSFEVVVEAQGAPAVRLPGSLRQHPVPAGKLAKWAAAATLALLALALVRPHVGDILQFFRGHAGVALTQATSPGQPSTQTGGQPSGGQQPGGQPPGGQQSGGQQPGAQASGSTAGDSSSQQPGAAQPGGQTGSSSGAGPGAKAGSSGGAKPQVWAYVWANQPFATSCYTPSPTYQFNTSGASNAVCRTGTGAYTVNLPNLGGPGGMVHVTAYGGGSESCNVSSWWPSGTTQTVNVLCFSAGGVPVDTYFTATFTRATAGDTSTSYAYLWADQPSATSYTPSRAYQWNSNGLVDTITHDPGVGSYVVHLPGLGAATGHVQVTSYGASSEHCKVVNWGPSGPEEQVRVSCVTVSGAPTDTRFTMTYAAGRSIVSPDGTHPGTLTGYAWAYQPSTASYALTGAYLFNDAGSGATISRSAVGTYVVTFPSLGADGDVQVTAYGAGSSYCKVTNWSPAGVGVRCFSPGGSPADSYYTVTIMRGLG